MKGLFRAIFGIIFLFSAFLVGFHFGKERQKEKIPEFQED